ncbi:MIP/aquaporin family protein [Corynebacterium sp.]|uniref:MIP/aquaporin family protein n=1 Tax=Corynebacterium sp. TaxID=1720 RepID=UPI0026DBCC97|nr:MIP/aquaporin family protein [Corynebacterium sp.]MDO5076750.1 MIP/aquaporin family protein [Corynebacterium sp.]
MIGAGQVFGWEFLGTAMLLLFGNGVCAANALRTSAARGSGWLVIALGWGLAVFIGASVADISGGHLNPAVTLMVAVQGNVAWGLVPFYIAGQLCGAMVGALLAWVVFKQMFDANNVDDTGKVTHANRATGSIFFTQPAHNHSGWNLATEFIGTFALLAFIAFAPGGDAVLGSLKYFAVSFIVVAIGLSLGTPTGYAINPARDLGPRLMYSFALPIKDKGNPNWSYAWIPILGPCLAAFAVGLLSLVLSS